MAKDKIPRNLSEGCKLCYQGAKLVLFISGLCDRTCWYCPLSEERKDVDVIFANDQKITTPDEAIEEAEIMVKYEGYIDKEREVADKLNRLEDVKLSPNFDYYSLNSLTMEAREKLTKHKPQTLGQASRISGISPADISVIAVFLGR